MGAVGCRCDNMTTAGVATELKWTRKFSENFIETDSSARLRQQLAYVYLRKRTRLPLGAADRIKYRQAAGAFAASGRRRNLNFDLNCMRRI
jgi:hypothetical protein